MQTEYKYNCRVCGLRQDEPIWGEDGNSPSYDICPCCGVEFGYGDTTIDNCKAIRKDWIAKGMKWSFPEEKPSNWSWDEQKKHIPPKYR